MKMLGDSIPAFKYKLVGEDLHIEGTGDPTFLHSKFNSDKAFNFLKNNGTKIILHWNNFDEEPFLPGWSWDDFRKDYLPERSQFPIYENLVDISRIGNSIKVYPIYFQSFTEIKEVEEFRDLHYNRFYIAQNKKKERIPFIVNSSVVMNILSEALDKKVELQHTPMLSGSEVLFSHKSKDLYKEMMENSNNFLAEQLLIISSDILPGKLSTSKSITFSKKNFLKDLKQDPKWFDGSGLSRYNLFTPENFVQVLEKLYKEFPEDQLFDIFPQGGKSGTIKNRYKDSPSPYIFAKTGTLNNHISLSGYLKTNSGRILIFSLLNNNSTKDISSIRNQNEKLLRIVRNNY